MEEKVNCCLTIDCRDTVSGVDWWVGQRLYGCHGINFLELQQTFLVPEELFSKLKFKKARAWMHAEK